MMVCYVAVPARIVGMRAAKPARTAQSGRAATLAGAAVTGLFGAIVCTPPYAIARGGIYLLGSGVLFPLGVALLIIGLMLEAGATGAVKAIKVSAKLLARPVSGHARRAGIIGCRRRRGPVLHDRYGLRWEAPAFWREPEASDKSSDAMKERASAPDRCWKLASIGLHQARDASRQGERERRQ